MFYSIVCSILFNSVASPPLSVPSLSVPLSLSPSLTDEDVECGSLSVSQHWSGPSRLGEDQSLLSPGVLDR